MDTGVDIDALKIEVAKRHGILLSNNDPIFATVTINELVLAKLLDRAQTAAETIEKRGAALMAQEIAAVKAAAERLIGGATEHFSQEVRKSAAAVENSIAIAVDRKIQAALAAAEKAEAAKSPALWAAAIAIGSAILTFGMALGKFVK